MPLTITNIGVHHFAGRLTLPQLNALHKSEWPDMPSELRPDLYVGYNFVIWGDGTFLQTRFIGEETCAQKGHNRDTVSISLWGNFSLGKDVPTILQIDTLRWLITTLVHGDPTTTSLKVKTGTTINITKQNIFPHRVLQPNHTECYGSALSDDWARNLFVDQTPTPLPPAPTTNGPELGVWKRFAQNMIQSLKRQIGLTTLGSLHRSCIKNVKG